MKALFKFAMCKYACCEKYSTTLMSMFCFRKSTWHVLCIALLCGTLTGCGLRANKDPAEPRDEFRSFMVLLHTLYYLHDGATNQVLCAEIEDFINAEIARTATRTTLTNLSSHDQDILRCVKGYWEIYPPEPREFVYTEGNWKKAQAYLRNTVPAVIVTPMHRADYSDQRLEDIISKSGRVALFHGSIPRMIVLECVDGATGSKITNCDVEVKGPAMYVSLYPNRATPGRLECRVELVGQHSTNAFQNMAVSGGIGPDLRHNVQIVVRSTNYLAATVSIPARDLAMSNIVERTVKLTPK